MPFYIFLTLSSMLFWNVTQHIFVVTPNFKSQDAQEIILYALTMGLITRPETSVATYQSVPSRAKILFKLRRKSKITLIKS
jgi:hypothetical protein